MKESYLPELNEMYQKIASKLQQVCLVRQTFNISYGQGSLFHYYYYYCYYYYYYYYYIIIIIILFWQTLKGEVLYCFYFYSN